jgi:hypothetical protein
LESNVAFADEVWKVEPYALVVLGYFDDEAEVALDQSFERTLVAGRDLFSEFLFLFGGEKFFSTDGIEVGLEAWVRVDHAWRWNLGV